MRFFFSLVQSAATCFFSLLEVCRRSRTTVLCTAAAEHENHLILSPSASVRVVVVAPAVMSESDHLEHSDVDTHKSAADTHKSAADTHKSVDTGDSGQPKNTTFRGSKSEFHHALAVSNIMSHTPIILEMEKDQYGHDALRALWFASFPRHEMRGLVPPTFIVGN
ncbi:hypothetical protein KIW84_032233 [Lathyrus oleraceus]|uniref:Uncharacterized protein n=1 Tax=Pisum sativum TaxID=3888 RepID=A0A9D5AYF6_PEA|nr:hypothetical protein KIW84_032233 [Pisum sativum]